MTLHRVHRLYTPEWGKLEVVEEEDGIVMNLKDLRNNKSVSHKYWFYKDSLATMLFKLDRIIHRMEDELEEKENEEDESI